MFAQRLRELRRERGLTQIQLAQKLNVSNGTVGMWETGKREPDFETITRLATFFHVSTDYLLGHVNNPFFHLDNERILREINSNGDGDEQEKKPTPVFEDGQDNMERQLMQYVRDLNPDQQQMLLAQMQVMKEAQKGAPPSAVQK